MPQRLLLLEDDSALGEGIALALRGGEMDVTLCRTVSDARQELARAVFDLLILDVNLPDGSGLDLLREVRMASAVPVILLTANDMETDIVGGLESGADDYITKPFGMMELISRVNALLRRHERDVQTGQREMAAAGDGEKLEAASGAVFFRF